MMQFLQKLGKSLMLPVCVLPVCGILMGIGYILCPASMQGGAIEGASQILGYLLVRAGGAIIDNMSILFVIGVSVGMACDGHGTAALSGIAGYLVITKLLSPSVMSAIFTGMTEADVAYLAFSKIENPFIGILSGCIGAECYNRFRSVRLPDAMAFFSGRRFVSIVTVLLSFLTAGVLAFLWPTFYSGMVCFGKWIASLGAVGCGLYAFFNRLLIPTGLHHALNNVFWFDTIGIGDLTKFWQGKTSSDVGWSLGMYMSGFFPCFIGGIPGASFAVYHCARNKKAAEGILLSAAICSVLCGVSEPFEFSFMFISFPLYVIYSALYGLFAVLTYLSGFRGGFAFSAGITDLVFSASLPAAAKTWMILPLSLLAFALYYAVFRFFITRFQIRIMDNEEEETRDGKKADGGNAAALAAKTAAGAGVGADAAGAGIGEGAGIAGVYAGIGEGAAIGKGAAADHLQEKEDGFDLMARRILSAVGGADNVVSADCCATRLRLELKDSSLVNAGKVKSAGAVAVICPDKTSCQVVIGPTVQQVLEAFERSRSEQLAQRSADDKEAQASDKTYETQSAEKAGTAVTETGGMARTGVAAKTGGITGAGAAAKAGGITGAGAAAKTGAAAAAAETAENQAGTEAGGRFGNRCIRVGHGDVIRICLNPETLDLLSEENGREQSAGFPASGTGFPASGENSPAPAKEHAPVPLLTLSGLPACRFTVHDPAGIHARPAGQLAEIAKKYGCPIFCEAKGKKVPASSPLQLMSLGLAEGDEVLFKAEEASEAGRACISELAAYARQYL